MYRQSSGRNHRSKGVKVKNILQICLLLAVCFWLIYQVKHSHDKKKEFDESDAKASLHTASSDELIRLGRKGMRSGVEGSITKSENLDEPLDDEEVNGEEADETKHEEDEPEENKVEGKEDDGIGGGDDETDEHEEEKSDGELGREQELVEGDEREDGDERETQETDSEDGHVEIEKKGTTEETDHDGENSTHEAREEHYKADDASSAVTHDAQIVTTDQNVIEHVENSNEHPENALEEENKESNTEETYSDDRKEVEVEVGGGEVARNDHTSNETISETKVDMLDNNQNGSSTNNTVPEGSKVHLTSNSKTDVTIETHDLNPQNATEIKPELSHDQGNLTEFISSEESDLHNIDSEGLDNSTLNVDSTHLDSNSTGSLSDNSTASSASENVLISEASMEAGNNTELLSEQNNEDEAEKLDTSDGTDESLETTLSENPEEVQQDAIDLSDTSNHMLEKDVRTDLDTLPDIQTEGTNSEDVAAE